MKASQFEHFTETYVKKQLSDRWNKFEEGDVQRDAYSAFLIMNTKDNLKEIDVDRARETFVRTGLLRTARNDGLNCNLFANFCKVFAKF